MYLNVDEFRVSSEPERSGRHVAAYLHRRTVLTPGYECAPTTHSRTAVTFLAASTMSGHLFIGCVLPGQRQWRFPSARNGVWVLYNENGYVDTGVFLAFLSYVLERVPRPAVVLSDAAKYHHTAIVQQLLEAHGARSVGIPPNTTGALQPLDISVFATLKNAFDVYFALCRRNPSFGDLKTTRNLHRLIITAVDYAAERVRTMPRVLTAGWRDSGLLRIVAPRHYPEDVWICLAAFQGGSVCTSEFVVKHNDELLDQRETEQRLTAVHASFAASGADVARSHFDSAANKSAERKSQIDLTPEQELALFHALAAADRKANASEGTYAENNSGILWPGACGTSSSRCVALRCSLSDRSRSPRFGSCCIAMQFQRPCRMTNNSKSPWNWRDAAVR